jgi:hypothetical protein
MEIFLVCASVDFVALMDQTSLAASLTIIGQELGASSRNAWIAGGYFVYVRFKLTAYRRLQVLMV